MTNKKESRGFSNFGFTTILLSFVMLCVVTFSGLSLITAYSDYKLSQKVADKAKNYYAASENATDTLIAIEQILIQSYYASANEALYYSKIQTQLAKYGIMELTEKGLTLAFKETISENNYLSVKIGLYYPVDISDPFYDILEWKSVYEKEFPTEEILNLIH